MKCFQYILILESYFLLLDFFNFKVCVFEKNARLVCLPFFSFYLFYCHQQFRWIIFWWPSPKSRTIFVDDFSFLRLPSSFKAKLSFFSRCRSCSLVSFHPLFCSQLVSCLITSIAATLLVQCKLMQWFSRFVLLPSLTLMLRQVSSLGDELDTDEANFRWTLAWGTLFERYLNCRNIIMTWAKVFQASKCHWPAKRQTGKRCLFLVVSSSNYTFILEVVFDYIFFIEELIIKVCVRHRLDVYTLVDGEFCMRISVC